MNGKMVKRNVSDRFEFEAIIYFLFPHIERWGEGAYSFWLTNNWVIEVIEHFSSQEPLSQNSSDLHESFLTSISAEPREDLG
jgi:hypothetical protein